ncbi:UNVERIFIED_CONTAM: hypothetical protein NCL1_53256 [Trichonephila clavipes]
MFGSRSLQLDERRQASRRSLEAWILTSRKVFSEESERKSESSYWLLKSEDNDSEKMAAYVGGVNVSGVVTDVQWSNIATSCDWNIFEKCIKIMHTFFCNQGVEKSMGIK